MMNHVAAQAAQLGVTRVVGEYIPTAKNGTVQDFFQQCGFARTSATNNLWPLDVAAYQPYETFIRYRGFVA